MKSINLLFLFLLFSNYLAAMEQPTTPTFQELRERYFSCRENNPNQKRYDYGTTDNVFMYVPIKMKYIELYKEKGIKVLFDKRYPGEFGKVPWVLAELPKGWRVKTCAREDKNGTRRIIKDINGKSVMKISFFLAPAKHNRITTKTSVKKF